MRETKFRAWDKKNKRMEVTIQVLFYGIHQLTGSEWERSSKTLGGASAPYTKGIGPVNLLTLYLYPILKRIRVDTVGIFRA
jgi:hypothetical protein